ncbi:hypothetical protein [Ottowia testudinis]|uniref:Uncharacterized protein n=1 Tax=Ottowia testudinis TaxID=2816950 RepID=A0A975CIU7_9BURK|nr:hypothetical protein [Ottowia testudinis]QTD46990.1 hypothetical protein J1M35_09050 [Ottowia testudinis]
MSTPPLTADVAAEHAVLLRHWAGVQARVSRQACEQAGRCAELEAELMRLRARWVVATTQLLWGLGWPGLGPTARRYVAEGGAPTSAADVICQTGCVSQAHHWLDEQGQCRLTGRECARDAKALS